MSRSVRIADLFCGAGGTSTGAIQAIEELGHRPNLVAVNHWPLAVTTHSLNHPEARHLCASVDSLNPREVCPDGLDLLWASPECTHHSRARGGKPMNDQSRASAHCVTRWAEALAPSVIFVENVPEFLEWGPLGANGLPLKSRKGETFAAWVRMLESLGYKVEWRLLCAADFGDPTTRTRLFVQCVRGRRKISWPEPTHAAPSKAGDLFKGFKPRWRSAREIIDWGLPSRSIFSRERPLKPNTLRRIFAGLERFGIKPSLVSMEHRGSVRSVESPVPTVTTARGGAIGLAEPFLVQLRGTSDSQISGSAKSIDDPVQAVTAGGIHSALVEPCLLPQQSDGRLRPVSEPAPTVSTAGAIALVEPYLIAVNHGNGGDPNGDRRRVRSVDLPLGVVTTSRGEAIVEPFLVEYYGTGGARPVSAPVGTVTTKGRFGLVEPEAMPVVEADGKLYRLDLKFRMLQPHELAAAQGFPSDYKFSGNKTEAVKQIGNAVPCGLARALVKEAFK